MSTSLALHFVQCSSGTSTVGLLTVRMCTIPTFRMQISSNSLSLDARQPVAIVRLTQEDEPMRNTDG